MSKFNERLRELRKDSDMTQAQLGELLNISHSTINRYESGMHEPDINAINKLANIFEVTTDYLLGRTNIKEMSILEGDEVPEELRAIGIDYMEVDKMAKEHGITPEDIQEIVETLGKIQKRNSNR
ncbi:helix-turn-helix domain-containing protein [Wukongibacter sp. M2B1]|uniref:helix-turn-helix domain-containing protein n=1 Tax=Wukongibacter sp. M2B1 TaxID=3088895 RepID=UPI003D7B75B5